MSSSAGERPGRTWSEPVALIDILRSAVGEVAEYQRVEVYTDEEVSLAPPSVADVIHLLAELIDNATVYSPAPSPVTVRAALVAKGLAVEIEDRGLGMAEEDYDSLNAQLADPPQFDVVALADDLRLGMFVVSQLAHRHGVTVTLRPSPYGGTTAIVLLPHEVVVVADRTPDAGRGRPPPGRPPPARTRPCRRCRRGNGRPARAAARGAAEDGPEAGSQSSGEPDGGASAAEDRPAPAWAGSARAGAEPAHGDTGAARAGARGQAAASRQNGSGPRPQGRPRTAPRRVPQTSLAAELLEDPAAAAPYDDEFTAEHAASSLAGFQQGTFRARDAVGDEPQDGPPRVPAPASGHPTPTADADR